MFGEAKKEEMMRRYTLYVLFFSLAVAVLPAAAQTLIGNVPVGTDPTFVAVNTTTNKIYVPNFCGNDPNCGANSPGTVTVIDGVTDTTTTITVGEHSEFLVINPSTNKIYVTNRKDNTVSVINGATNTVTTTIPVGSHPVTADVNIATNKIYVANTGNGVGNTVSVIDGSTDTVTATVTVGYYPASVAVDSVTNKIYVADFCGNDINCLTDGGSGTLTVIDGATLNTTTIAMAEGPGVVLVNRNTNKIYVLNSCGTDPNCVINGTVAQGSVTVVDGSTLSTTTVNVGNQAGGMTLNLPFNRIYVTNFADNTLTFISGSTLATSTLAVDAGPADVEFDPIANYIYVTANSVNKLDMIDANTRILTSVGIGSSPGAAAVNQFTHRVYTANSGDSTASVVAGGGVKPCSVCATPR